MSAIPFVLWFPVLLVIGIGLCLVAYASGIAYDAMTAEKKERR